MLTSRSLFFLCMQPCIVSATILVVSGWLGLTVVNSKLGKGRNKLCCQSSGSSTFPFGIPFWYNGWL